MDCKNYTMTEAEAMQAARENMTYIEQLDHLIWSIVRDEGDFYEARKIALERAEKEGDDFRERPQSEVKYPLASTIASCFPELSEKNIEAILKWERRREKSRTRSEGRRGNSNNLWRIFGEAYFRAKGFVSRTKSELYKNRVFEIVDEISILNDMEHEKILSTQRVFQHMINRRYSGKRFNLPVRISHTNRTCSRSPRRSPVRSAAKSGDDSGDGDPDQGDPPRPSLTVPPPHSFPFNQKLNSFASSWVSPPSRWSMAGRWAA